MNHPDELFSKPNLEAQIDLGNPLVLEGHLQCAAYEMPLQPNDDQYFGNQMIDIAEQRMIKDDGGYYHCHPRFHPAPWKHVSIRDIEDDTYVIVDVTNQKNIVLEELEASRTLFTVYEGISHDLEFVLMGRSHLYASGKYLLGQGIGHRQEDRVCAASKR